MNTTKTHNAALLDTIYDASICLNPVWSHAYEIARLAEKLPASIRDAVRVMPSTAQVALEEAASRAREVLASNARRRAARKSALCAY